MAARLGVNTFGCEQVLDSQRNAFQRTRLALGQPRIGSLGHGPRLLRRLDDIGIENARLLHRREIGVGEFESGELLPAQPVAGGGNGEGGERVHSTTFGTMKNASSWAGALDTIFAG